MKKNRSCHQFDCPAYIVCRFGVGMLQPHRFQCSSCHEARITMFPTRYASDGVDYLRRYFGSIDDLLEYADNNKCAYDVMGTVPRDQLTRLCRRCCLRY